MDGLICHIFNDSLQYFTTVHTQTTVMEYMQIVNGGVLLFGSWVILTTKPNWPLIDYDANQYASIKQRRYEWARSIP